MTDPGDYQIGDLIVIDSPEHGAHGETGCIVDLGTGAITGWEYLVLVALGPGLDVEYAAVSAAEIRERT